MSFSYLMCLLGGLALFLYGMRMMGMAGNNGREAFGALTERGREKSEAVEHREEYVDFLNKEISKYITFVVSYETAKAGSQIFNALFSIAGNIERISDHAVNIAEYSNLITERGITFSEQANRELAEMRQICERLFATLMERTADHVGWHERIACMEQRIDDMTAQYRDNMYARIQNGKCSDEGSILFSEVLTDFERIGDHALNIANEMLKMAMIER